MSKEWDVTNQEEKREEKKNRSEVQKQQNLENML